MKVFKNREIHEDVSVKVESLLVRQANYLNRSWSTLSDSGKESASQTLVNLVESLDRLKNL